jgi:hypothetical protein
MINLNLIAVTATLFVWCSGSADAQTIRRVNNNDGMTGTNVYATVQAAHDAASNGDIILVEPSVTSYGDLKCAKNLKIYGNGYWLDKNGGNLKANLLSSKLGAVEFVPGSNGSEIYGCELSSWFWIQAASDITIARNRYSSLYIEGRYVPPVGVAQYANVTDILFTQNYGGLIDLIGYTVEGVDYTVSNTTVTNNYIVGAITTRSPVGNSVIKYNTIQPGSMTLLNAVFENNILIYSSTGSFDVVERLTGQFTASNSSLNYNINSANLFGAGIGTGNQNGIDLTLHFIAPTPDMSDDAQLRLKDDSALKSAGDGGTEVGMFGGIAPYVISGIPAIPAITNLKTTGTGSNSVPITVTFSAKSNN